MGWQLCINHAFLYLLSLTVTANTLPKGPFAKMSIALIRTKWLPVCSRSALFERHSVATASLMPCTVPPCFECLQDLDFRGLDGPDEGRIYASASREEIVVLGVDTWREGTIYCRWGPAGTVRAQET